VKKLTKIKLINWHSFLNETITLHGSVLLSGENGAGKSTILDAVQFVMMASKNNFNKAAHEAGNRKLTGYVRYKTGREKKPYERTGNVTSHVALEFFDEAKEETFLVGAVVDSSSEDSEKTIWYLLDNEKITDALFFDEENQILSIERFRKKNHVERYFKTQTEARTVFRHKFGRLEEKFFDLVPKSLAFKPIDDIKDFVYSYVLDKKEVNIEELRENIMTYQSLTAQLRDIKNKVGSLEKIVNGYDGCREAADQKKGLDYFLARASLEEEEERLEQKQKEISENRELLELLKKQEEALRETRESSAGQYHNLLAECKSNQDFLALDAVEKELAQAVKNYENTKESKIQLEKKIRKSLADVKKIAEKFDEDELKKYISVFSACNSWNEIIFLEEEEKQNADSVKKDKGKNEKGDNGEEKNNIEENSKEKNNTEKNSKEKNDIEENSTQKNNNEESNMERNGTGENNVEKNKDGFFENYRMAESLLDFVMEYKIEIKKKYQKKEFELQTKKQEMMVEEEKLRTKIKKLEKKNLVYDKNVLKLKKAVEAELKRAGREGEVRILCELLNVSRETWRNAVEGYLNQQRFYLLVDPENFDLAVSAYDKLHKKEHFYGAGIINTSKLDAYDTAPEGSLAQMVESKNKFAKRFVNMLLGRVMCCEKAEQLRQYEISITPECLRYQNHVISAISPKHYQVPYIGADAYKIQYEQAQAEECGLRESMERTERELEEIREMNRLCDGTAETEIKYGMTVFVTAKQEEERLEKLQREKQELSENSNYIEKQLKLQELEKEQKRQEKEYELLLKKQGEAEKMLTLGMEEREKITEQKKLRENALGSLEESLGEELRRFQMQYAQENQENKIRDFGAIKKKFFAKKSRLERSLQAEESKVVSAMQEYRFAYQFGAEASMENYHAFYQEYDKLKNSEILNYEERAEQAREASEQEFKEQFLAKLQENIKQAQREFKELNKSLENIPFGREHYRFECMPAKKYEAFYHMIMSDFNIMSGVSIFSGVFHENNREVIDELFDRLMAGGENGAALVEEFTDYRSYMDYDIRMENEDGSYSYYSKVCKEKSGGETQTPFYVTVAASFVQLYTNGIGKDSIGIVLFDEAFNNMDDERIGGVLGFFRELPLQLLVAAPPEKIQYIAPWVDSTLLVMQGEKRSYVEEFLVR
jgi:uncharacterized protein YPO0396